MKQILMTMVLLSLTSTCWSLELGQPSDRANTWELGLLVNRMGDWEVSGENGSSVDVDADTGWGFSVGYNVNEHLNFGFGFTHNYQSYDLTIVPQDPAGPATTLNHKLTNDTFALNMTYHLLARELTPFVTAGLGWSDLDSNVSDGDSGVVCWWDPWWGYVCSNYYSTYSETSFSYNLGAGLRWDMGSSFSLKASINQRWMDLDRVDKTVDSYVGLLEFVWRR
ncbi:porin family protein [Pseudomaricurvus sp. HS19]|uniref:porin family protein n=1 Tax=Pseudomaricurvus sp. HS19 TaxID=2692626 RepID=UPI00136945EF|nr:porin family protein [Pseudomaricurvus sp. HS19]MYM63060.1 outer membrane beta-barrel protein [Pseudomaricurvus sp. HS19]